MSYQGDPTLLSPRASCRKRAYQDHEPACATLDRFARCKVPPRKAPLSLRALATSAPSAAVQALSTGSSILVKSLACLALLLLVTATPERGETAITVGSEQPIIDRLTESFRLAPSDEGNQTDSTRSIAPLGVERDPGKIANEIVFIDPGVEDYETLEAGFREGVEVLILKDTQDGVTQISQALLGKTGLDAIHLISHGSAGSLQLGSTELSSDRMAHYSNALSQIRSSLTETGDIMLYGCDVAQGDTGQEFVLALANATDADVAASIDKTGAMILGGNWDLEYSHGEIGETLLTKNLHVTNFYQLLDTESPTATVGLEADFLSSTSSSTGLTITFSEDPVGFDEGDLILSNGSIAAGSYDSSNYTYTALFTADSNVEATGGVELVAGSYEDAAGNPGGGSSDTADIDTRNPTSTITFNGSLLSSASNTTEVTIAFSEDPVGFDETDLVVSNGILSGFSGQDTVWTATFEAASNFAGVGMVQLPAGSYTDHVDFLNPGVGSSGDISIDTENPTATVDLAVASLSDSNNSTALTITFTEVPTGFDAGADLTVSGGVLSAGSFDASNKIWTATYTANDGITGTGSVFLASGSYTDAVGNDGSGASDSVAINPLYATEYANNCTGTDGASPCVDNRIEIADLAQLRRLSERSQDWVTNTTIVLTADIDATDTATWNVGNHDNDVNTAEVPMGFSPIGIASTADFAAIFDGDGHVISNLFIDRPASNDIGLFGSIDGAVIKDLTLTDVDITGDTLVGGLVGDGVNSQISNASTSGSVTGAGIYVGGLVGQIGSGTITASYATVAVTGLGWVGGLVGYLVIDSAIDDSYATGAITGTSGSGHVGGLVGSAFNDSAINGSYSIAVVVGGSGANLGGLVGYARQSATVTDSYWSTDNTTQSKGIGNAGNGGFLDYDGPDPQGLTSAQMLQQSSFTGFAFVGNPPGDPVSNTPWVIIDGSTQPYLYWQDDDGDGILAYLDSDDDNDGVDDDNDAFPLISLGGLIDTDGDGRPNDCDTTCQASGMSADIDDDNDGVVDDNDRYPLVSLTVNAGTANEESLPDANGNGAPDAVGANCDEACIIAAGMALDQAPTAVDVYAATLVSTASAPQSATVVLEGADPEADALTYTVVSAPSNGTLSDPNNGNSAVTTGAIAGQTLTYTPTTDYTGTDTFTYRVNDGVSDSAATYTATITVFDAVLTQARQIGADIDGEAADDYSGTSVALSSDGQTLVVGAVRNEDNFGSFAGHVRVYAWSGSAWSQLGADIDGEGDGSGGAAGDQSGYSVALSSDGQTLAVGAPYNDGNGFEAGHVRVYAWNGSAWNQLGNDIDGEAQYDESGTSVALSSDGQTLAVGAVRNEDNFGSFAGHVRVYAWNGSAWSQLGGDIDGEAAGDQSGYSVALSSDGQTLAVGAFFNDGSGADAGHVRVYAWDGSVWTRLGGDIDGEAAGDQSGYSVALSSDGQTLAVGAPYNDGTDTFAGHVRVYAWNGSAWNQLGNDIDGEAQYDQSGYAVALSSDGQTLAVGARGADRPPTGNGIAAGHVRVYAWNGSAWNQLGNDIDGEAQYDESGTSVALSSDGQTLAVGAPYNDGNGADAGHVRVYDLKTFAPEISGSPNLAAVPSVAYQAFDNPATAGDATERLTVSDPDPADNNRTFSATAGGGPLPGWLAVDAATGALSGTPTADDVGVLANVVLTVSDGTLSADLPAFDLTVLLDTDEDGQPDNCDANCVASGFTVDADDDNDGVVDADDAFPLISVDGLTDTDGDGVPNDCDTACQATGMSADTDDDNDGVVDTDDAFPLISVDGLTDTDGDGRPNDCDTACQATGMSADTDDDNDLVDDVQDDFPTDPDETADTDSDGLGDNADQCDSTATAESDDINASGCGPSERDTDGDGTNDNLDAFPNDPNETLDSDGDGYGDNEETEAGTDPNDADDQPIQSGLPIWLLYEASKS